MRLFGRFFHLGIAVLLVFCCLDQTQAKLKLKKLIKAGLILGALGSAKLPRIIPLPIPIPLKFERHHTFTGGQYGEYPGYRGPYYAHGGHDHIPYGHGGYAYGSGGYGSYGSEWW